MRMCAIVANGSSKAGVVCLADESLFQVLCPRKTQIAIGEMLGVVLAFKYFPNEIKDAQCIFYIDNMGVLHNIVNGTSTGPDLTAFSLAIHHKMFELNASAWLEYVASASNLADGGPRDGVDCPLAAQLGIPLRLVTLPSLPRLFPMASPEDWDKWWRE